MTELDANHGTSVTNRVELLVTWVCTALQIAPDRLRWLERYLADRTQRLPERWSLVQMTYAEGRFWSPRWSHVAIGDWAALPLTLRPAAGQKAATEGASHHA